MPELPEVETVVRELRRVLPGGVIARASLTAGDLYRSGSRRVSALAGARVLDVGRRGKAIVVRCEPGDLRLVVHLGMTGQLRWTGARPIADGAPRRTPHLHARWEFRDGSRLEYIDPRRFGFIFVGDTAGMDAAIRIGPDPFEITADALADALRGRRAPVKALLLDQRIVSGLGNIYVDESLYAARVHPLTTGDRAAAETATILSAARRILERAIRSRGTTLRDYRRPDGSRGRFQLRLAVYGREGEACRACGCAVERIEVAQRGTHFCPRCQARPRGVSAARRTRSADRSRRAVPRPEDYTRSR
jgi:formamidopyrimidine-DNA glycosylase